MDLETALYALMVPSGNDAAIAIAKTVGALLPGFDGTYAQALFVAAMNAKAAELGGIEYDVYDGGFAYDVVQLTPSSADLGALMDLFGSSASSQAVEELLGVLKQEGVLS